MHKIPANPLLLGKNRVVVPECHSTNTYLAGLISQAAQPEGTLVITPNQIAGRGQRGNVWLSEPGKNLTFSLLLKPTFLLPRQQFELTMAVALGLADLLELMGLRASIKWPNDVLVDELKVAGILIENQLQGEVWTHAITGIGLNVNQQHFALPHAVSLVLLTGQSYSLDEILELLLACVEARYGQLKARDQSIKTDYLARLYRLNEPHEFEVASGKCPGTIIGVDDGGRLKVDHAGIICTYDLKEIKYL